MQKAEVLNELEKTLKTWTSTSVGRRAFLQAVPLLLASCATGVGHRYREGDNAGQRVNLTPDQERRMASDVLPTMQKTYPALRDQEMQNYVSNLGRRMVAENGLDGNPYNYSFKIVETEQINAFAPVSYTHLTLPTTPYV